MPQLMVALVLGFMVAVDTRICGFGIARFCGCSSANICGYSICQDSWFWVISIFVVVVDAMICCYIVVKISGGSRCQDSWLR